MREKLIELISDSLWSVEIACRSNPDINPAATIADRLLANGVIVPPCKVGDIAYQHIYHKKGYSHTLKEKVVGVHIIDAPSRYGHTRGNYIITHNETTNSVRHISFSKIGKTVFLTREEAEAALKEGQGDGVYKR